MALGGRQLTFELSHRPAFGRENFLVAPCNQLAVDWVDLWPDWPAPMLVLCGPAGAGKSHLAAVWQNRAGALSVDPLAIPDLCQTGELLPAPLLLDRASTIKDENKLLHLYNRTVEQGRTLLLIDRQPASRWNFQLSDLTSRLKAAPTVQIGMPDDPLIEALLVKLFSDRQVKTTPEVISYLMSRMERSFGAAQSIVGRLDSMAFEEKRMITVPLARLVLEQSNTNFD